MFVEITLHGAKNNNVIVRQQNLAYALLSFAAQMVCSIRWSRSAVEQLLFVLALLGATQGFYLPGVAPQDYAKVILVPINSQGQPSWLLPACLHVCASDLQSLHSRSH